MSDRHKKEHKKGHKKDHKKDERKDHKSHDHVMEASGVDSIVVTNPIDMSCFYMKNDEFRVWLKLEKSKAFEDLSTPISHEYFEKFIKYYNRGSLPQMYYTTIPSEIKDSCKKSTHK
jgi:ABC-type Zn2+ transport system substrate-binding protein/surface adhesin